MTRASDEAHSVQLGWVLDLSALVADARAERPESLPQDPVFALAVVVLACLDKDTLSELLEAPQEVLEGAGRHFHAEVRLELALRALRDLVRQTKNPEGEQK